MANFFIKGYLFFFSILYVVLVYSISINFEPTSDYIILQKLSVSLSNGLSWSVNWEPGFFLLFKSFAFLKIDPQFSYLGIGIVFQIASFALLSYTKSNLHSFLFPYYTACFLFIAWSHGWNLHLLRQYTATNIFLFLLVLVYFKNVSSYWTILSALFYYPLFPLSIFVIISNSTLRLPRISLKRIFLILFVLTMALYYSNFFAIFYTVLANLAYKIQLYRTYSDGLPTASEVLILFSLILFTLLGTYKSHPNIFKFSILFSFLLFLCLPIEILFLRYFRSAQLIFSLLFFLVTPKKLSLFTVLPLALFTFRLYRTAF